MKVAALVLALAGSAAAFAPPNQKVRLHFGVPSFPVLSATGDSSGANVKFSALTSSRVLLSSTSWFYLLLFR